MRNSAYILSLLIAFALVSCGGSTDKKEIIDDTPIVFGEHKVEVYYFHGDRRCPGCNAIEKVSSEAVKDNFADNNDVAFFAINFDKKENKDIARKYEITWSSLVIVSGDKAIDLTLEAFQLASTNPDNLKKEILDVINTFLAT